ncbi:hypothetical protein GGH99_004594 [Coemansia sp. RSA 1285]|nr:hypothetical protein GGH99_004594 [Coemansia sp. RSA 1285]
MMLLVYLQIFFCIFATAPGVFAELSSIILPLESTVWSPGAQTTITYRITGSIGSDSYEIDLTTGSPNNAQLVYVFENEAKPTVVGVNSVSVAVPDSIPAGEYAVRMGVPTGPSSWVYSQMFTISSTTSAMASTHNPDSLPDSIANESYEHRNIASESPFAAANHQTKSSSSAASVAFSRMTDSAMLVFYMVLYIVGFV